MTRKVETGKIWGRDKNCTHIVNVRIIHTVNSKEIKCRNRGNLFCINTRMSKCAAVAVLCRSSSDASVSDDFREQSPLYATAVGRSWTCIFPSVRPVAVLNLMFPLLYPVCQERGLFWKIGSRQEQLKIPHCLNKGPKHFPERSQTPGKWSAPAALRFLHKHEPLSAIFTVPILYLSNLTQFD